MIKFNKKQFHKNKHKLRRIMGGGPGVVATLIACYIGACGFDPLRSLRWYSRSEETNLFHLLTKIQSQGKPPWQRGRVCNNQGSKLKSVWRAGEAHFGPVQSACTQMWHEVQYMHSFIESFIDSFIYSFIHSFYISHWHICIFCTGYHLMVLLECQVN